MGNLVCPQTLSGPSNGRYCASGFGRLQYPQMRSCWVTGVVVMRSFLEWRDKEAGLALCRVGRGEDNAGFGAVGGGDDPHAETKFNQTGVRKLIALGDDLTALQAVAPPAEL